MEGAKAGMQGGTPILEKRPVDPNLPRCGELFVAGPFEFECSRAKGHYGKHGSVSQDGTIVMEDKP